MFSNFSHLNAKLLAAPQGNYNSGMLAVDLCRIATQAMSHSEDLFVYHPSAFTELHEKRPIESDKRATSDNGGLAATGQLRWSRLSCVPSECMKSDLRQCSKQSLYGLPGKR
jgi:hypothetical protein